MLTPTDRRLKIVIHRIGGLEKTTLKQAGLYKVIHRIGGLENPYTV